MSRFIVRSHPGLGVVAVHDSEDAGYSKATFGMREDHDMEPIARAIIYCQYLCALDLHTQEFFKRWAP